MKVKLWSELKDIKENMNGIGDKMEKYEKSQTKGICHIILNMINRELGIEIKIQHAYKIN